MGAIRPPWISKKWFYKTPFNYCDRWCEKCSLTEVCPVYKKEQERKIRHIKEGKNPYSWECVFEDVKETLEETKKLIKKQAKKEGIDLKKQSKMKTFKNHQSQKSILFTI